jgi:hypothetical protein
MLGPPHKAPASAVSHVGVAGIPLASSAMVQVPPVLIRCTGSNHTHHQVLCFGCNGKDTELMRTRGNLGPTSATAKSN